MRLIEHPNLQTILVIGVALAIAPALVLVVAFGLAILINNPPLTIFEFALVEVEALALWLGILLVALVIYYRRKQD